MKKDFEEFIRKNWAGGIGQPNTDLEDIFDVIEEIKRCQRDAAGAEWQRAAFLYYAKDNKGKIGLWVSGSRHGAIIAKNNYSIGFDAQTSSIDDLLEYCDEIVTCSVNTIKCLLCLFKTLIGGK